MDPEDDRADAGYEEALPAASRSGRHRSSRSSTHSSRRDGRHDGERRGGSRREAASRHRGPAGAEGERYKLDGRRVSRAEALPNSSRRMAAIGARKSKSSADATSDSDAHRNGRRDQGGSRTGRSDGRSRDGRSEARDRPSISKREKHRSGSPDEDPWDEFDERRDGRRAASAKSQSRKSRDGGNEEETSRRSRRTERRARDAVEEAKRDGRDLGDGGKSSAARGSSKDPSKERRERSPPFDDMDGADEIGDVDDLPRSDDDATDRDECDDDPFDEGEFDGSDVEDFADRESVGGGVERAGPGRRDAGGGGAERHDDESDGDDVGGEYCPGDLESEYQPSVVSAVSKLTRSNSPELNPNSIHLRGNSEEIVLRQLSSDPPVAGETVGHRRANSLDPVEEIGSVYQRALELDAPPSPKGPELRRKESDLSNLRRKDSDLEPNARREAEQRPSYTNYMLDDVGMEQYRQQRLTAGSDCRELSLVNRAQSPPFKRQQPTDPDNNDKRKTKVSLDPPETNRGVDPAPLLPRGPRVRSSKSKRDCVDIAAAKQIEKKEKKQQVKQPVSILKKKGAAPIAYFGKPVGPPPDEDLDAIRDDVSSGSEPDVAEQKSVRPPPSAAEEGDGKSAASKSGMRTGKYAALNEAARLNGGEMDGSKDSAEVEEESSDDDSDEESDGGNTLETLTQANDDERFDRSRTYYLRTSDLGLTQDTIFAEQFLTGPNDKAEPHYHHPSPHPPPGVQFHVDENWIAINDGKGGHSPIAPQAVDALVAVGYRAACDPVMWTPSSKTRKYMTEKGLRFDDVPLPGPLDEGEGGPADSNCMVWSGKFTHKYYGHELLAIRSQGVVNMSAEDLVDLLMDSTRIQEYNKSSSGRTDEIILSDGSNIDRCPFSGQRRKKLTGVVMNNTRIVDGVAVMDSQSEDERSDVEDEIVEEFDEDGVKSVHTFTSTRHRKKSSFVGVTKVVRSINIIPLVKKKMDFITLLHCRALTDDQGGNGFIIVGRNVCPGDDPETSGGKGMRSEVLLNVHIIRKFKPKKKGVSAKKGKGDSRSVVSGISGQPASQRELANRCLMINVSHLKSPMVPNLMAKKMGLSAAASFISDIRGLTE